ncbi:piggyBac transposable element-derived protein 4-like [Ischnura elegans]|uniref:piggyBac transposable element-derived protein 4-like n=1 Tax=Ischnura elegans TaxID=197161 RepID=UPI001ED8A7F0|nr:piggyBac transposable element-derived protein 4-like [Ischnura elegans]
MSRKRFHFILQSLRFDDKATRSDRKLLDKLAPVREVFDIFVQNCRESYSLGEYVTIDEMLSKFRGRCAFRQYIPSKPGKYGIKIFSLADSKTFYTGNLEVYVGKQPEGPFYVSNSANDVVKRLVRPIAHSGRNITADNWFTSYELVLDLLKANLTYVGTVRKNKRQLPPSFTSPVGREPFTTRFGFDRHCTLVSYIPKPRKNVILISSMHHDSTIDETTGNSNKPEIVTFYNATKSGVDVVDKLCATYSVARNTKRWPMTIFYTMLNVAAINAQVIYLVNNKESSHAILKRRHFIKVLAQELTKEHLQKRSHVVNLPRELRKRTLAISEKDKETEHNESSTSALERLFPFPKKTRSGRSGVDGTFKEEEPMLTSGKTSVKKVCDKLADALRANGVAVTGPQCKSKINGLKKTYRSIKDHNNRSGNSRRTWVYLELMDSFEKKSWMAPARAVDTANIVEQDLSSSPSSSSGSGRRRRLINNSLYFWDSEKEKDDFRRKSLTDDQLLRDLSESDEENVDSTDDKSWNLQDENDETDSSEDSGDESG